MKSVKPGRGPSVMGVWGAVVAVVFGILWTIGAVSMGAPLIFPVFGVLFILMGVGMGLYHLHNVKSKQRFSLFDVTENGEETDPLEQRFSSDSSEQGTSSPAQASAGYCPYCGAAVEDADYRYCRGCGKELPKG